MRCSSRERLRAIVGLIALALVAVPAAALDVDAAMKQSRSAIGRTPANYEFTASDGRRVRLADFRGKPLLVSFVYTGCGQVCPTATRSLDKAVRQASDALGSDAFNIATIGFNLPFDNAAAMRDFARHQGIERAQWKFLSPDAGSVDGLTGEFGFTYAASTGGFDHVTQLSIVDADGRIVQQLYGEAFDPKLLVAAVRGATAGAPLAPQDFSDLVSRVRILCTVYDPRTGAYRLDYGLFIEIFAGLTVLGATLHFLMREWRAGRRQTRTTASQL